MSKLDMLRDMDEQTGRAWLLQTAAILFIRMLSVLFLVTLLRTKFER